MHQIIKSVFLQLFELIFHRQTIAQIFSTHQLVAYGLGLSFIFSKKLPVYGFGNKVKNPYYENPTFLISNSEFLFFFLDRFDGPQEYHYMKFLQHAIQKSAPFMPDAFFRNV